MAPAFSPTEHWYTADVPLWVQRITLSATAAAPALVKLNGTLMDTHDPASIDLNLGMTTLEIEVVLPLGEIQKYSINITRAKQIDYLKASNPMQGAYFGQTIALSGDTIY